MADFIHTDEPGTFHGAELQRTVDLSVQDGEALQHPEALAFKRLLADTLAEVELSPRRYYQAANTVIMFCHDERVAGATRHTSLEEADPTLAIPGQLPAMTLVLVAESLARTTFGDRFANAVAEHYNQWADPDADQT